MNLQESDYPATVAVRFGAYVIVEDKQAALHRVYVGRAYDVVCGDGVVCRRGPGGDHLVAQAERRNLFARRRASGGKLQAIAANVDCVAAVFSLATKTAWAMLDQYLIACRIINAQPLIVFNKLDLSDASGDTGKAINLYRELGYTVLLTSALSGKGIGELAAALRNKVSLFAGYSGVGKTSLLNRLVPDLDARVRAVSASSGEGRHTTTATTLYRTPDGGGLMDSPGVRYYICPAVSPDEVLPAYLEFTAAPERCRFADCRHQQEPGCVVRDGVAAGRISTLRYQNYLEVLARIPEPQTF